HEIDVIDLVHLKRLPDIDITPLRNPHGLDFANGKLFFSAEGSRAVGSYDPTTKKVDWCMGTGEDRTHMLYATADAKRIYTTNVNAGTVSILQDTLVQPNFGPPPSANQNKPQGTPPPFQPKAQRTWLNTAVPVARGAEGFDVSPNGQELWTAASDDGTVFIVDVYAKKVIAQADVKTPGANRLKFTPDGKLVLVSSLRTGDLYIIDAATHALVKQINIGKGCAGILIAPDNKKALVASTADNFIAIVDLETLAVSNKISLGEPDGLAWGK
ncbi:MAG TPA: hypothetical protein VKT28_10580, partial [Puia sp.]|nr:hypothetical protein [Puia sp.]